MEVEHEFNNDSEADEPEIEVDGGGQRKFKIAKHLYTSGKNARLIISTFQKKRQGGRSVLDKTKSTSENKPTNELTILIKRIQEERNITIHSSQINTPTSAYYSQRAKDKLKKQIFIHNRSVALDSFRRDFNRFMSSLLPLENAKKLSRPISYENDILCEIDEESRPLKSNWFSLSLNSSSHVQQRGQREEHSNSTAVAVVGSKSALTRVLTIHWLSDFESEEMSFEKTAIELFSIGETATQISIQNEVMSLNKYFTYKIPENIPFKISAQANSAVHCTLINNYVTKGTCEWREYCDNKIHFKQSI